MNIGFWFTRDDYTSALPTSAGAMDVGGLDTALKVNGPVLLRPYFKGNPSPASVATTILDMEHRAVTTNSTTTRYYQVGNEPNLPEVEDWQGGLDAYEQFFDAVRDLLPTSIRLAWAGMSPGKPGYLDWYRRARAHRVALVVAHVYDPTLDGMKNLLAQILDAVGDSILVGIGESNFGPGPGVVIDRDEWADDVWGPFADHVRDIQQVPFLIYFAWTWNADTPIATPVDAKGTRVHSVTIRKAVEAMSADIQLSAPSRIQLTMAHGPQRINTRGAFVHATRSGIVGRSLQLEYQGTINYFMNPNGDSAQFVVGPVEVCRMVHDANESYHAEENNRTHLSIEIAQPTLTAPYTDFQYIAAAEIVRKWADKYNFPKTRVFSQTQRGIIGHEDSEQGKRYGKSDPGPAFDWTRFIKLVNDGGTMAYDPTPDRDAVYGRLTSLQTTEIRRLREGGYTHLAKSLSDAMEAAKETISVSKGEK